MNRIRGCWVRNKYATSVLDLLYCLTGSDAEYFFMPNNTMAIVSKLQLPRFRNVGGHCGGFVVAAAAVVILRGASLAECLLGQFKHLLLPKYADVYTLPAFNEICNLWQPLIQALDLQIQSLLQLLKFYSISYTVPCCYCLKSVCSQ